MKTEDIIRAADAMLDEINRTGGLTFDTAHKYRIARLAAIDEARCTEIFVLQNDNGSVGWTADADWAIEWENQLVERSWEKLPEIKKAAKHEPHKMSAD